MTATLYPAGFYEDRRRHTAHAARRILSLLPRELLGPRIADIGCGTGTFLAAARALGVTETYGIEGSWVTPAMLDDPRIHFENRDLAAHFHAPAVDLALSLEVAEHLPPERAPGFIADLVAIAPATLFSAAIPGQGGVGHCNEAWPSVWAALFAAHGRVPLDIIRPAIWTDEAIPAWYRQNTILFLAPEHAERFGLPVSDPGLLDRVHPAFWSRANRELGYANALPESEILRRRAEATGQ